MAESLICTCGVNLVSDGRIWRCPLRGVAQSCDVLNVHVGLDSPDKRVGVRQSARSKFKQSFRVMFRASQEYLASGGHSKKRRGKLRLVRVHKKKEPAWKVPTISPIWSVFEQLEQENRRKR